MITHDYLVDPSLSVSRGPPLEAEAGIGPLTLGGFLMEVARRHRPAEALVLRAADGACERWSYETLLERATDVARALVASGIGKGERVGVLMTNRPEFLSAVFGIALAGGVATVLSTFSTPDELDFLLEASGCSALLYERQVLSKDFGAILGGLEPACAGAAPDAFAAERWPFLRLLAGIGEVNGATMGWQAFLETGRDIPRARVVARAGQVSPADPGVLFFSSGSTARPKGILSSHRGVTLQMWRMAPQQGLGPGVRSWTANGFFWSGNFAMIVGGTLAAGGSIVLQPTFQPAEALSLMEAESVSFLFAWPHQWEQLIGAPNWPEADLSSLTYMDARSPIAAHPTVNVDWIEPRHAYGNTETFTLSTAYPAGTGCETAAQSHGLPLAGNTIRIVDPLTGTVTPRGEPGEITVKGPTLMLGYLGTALADTLDDEGYFRTGDGGWIDEAGRLHWQGRLNDIIKTGGANVSPLEIDEAILACPGVKLAQTVGVPHETLGELVVACVILHEGASLSEADIQAHTRTRLASYKVPRRVLFFAPDELRLTGSAKIKTAELRRLAAERL
ncbi:AMP-dependent synthetase [Novosphingobium sp. PC22D]|uniref:class I adenylate-forming enzyme family protein n=1 Tax=Novosphingobium sp. PC22D TaxID=1962403 RepID=UPI000BF10564|nr:class I adenylate-forming enzyme family protein [Novosphingobium sp. PC22D]PEQ12865.1 AMP-dependent synthetase [Novosphingobium sp. PC22D]